MVDPARVSALLHRIGEEIVELRELGARSDEQLLSQADALPAAKYRLVVAIEAATDVAGHIIAEEGFRPPVSVADSFRSLAEAGWLPENLSSELAKAARLRNLLVHQYADIDDQRVIRTIRTSLGDLKAFTTVIAERIQDAEPA